MKPLKKRSDENGSRNIRPPFSLFIPRHALLLSKQVQQFIPFQMVSFCMHARPLYPLLSPRLFI